MSTASPARRLGGGSGVRSQSALGMLSGSSSAGSADRYEETKTHSPPARQARPLSHHGSRTLSPPAPVRTGSLDPFAKVSSAFSPDNSRPGTPDLRARAEAARRRRAEQFPVEPLPPHMFHLHFAHHTFPLFLLVAASRLYRAKCQDLGIAHSKEKERRFVWLLCRQSMGGGGGVSGDPLADLTSGADDDVGGSDLLSFRVPDAALGPNALRELCTFLSNDPRFGLLQLSGNILGDEGAVCLAELLSRNSALVSLDVRGTGMGQHAFATLLDSVTTHPSLTSLDASSLKSDGRMFLGSVGAKALGRLLRRNTVLRKLHVANTGLGGGSASVGGAGECVGSLVRGLCLNRTLTSLDFSFNDLGPRSGGRILEAIAAVRSLEVLHLADNGLGDTGIALMADSLRKMESLRVLDLRRNRMGIAALTILTDCVGEMISLQELLLEGNTMGDHGSGAAARAAAKNLAAVTAGSFAASAGGAGAGSIGTEYVESLLKRLHLADKRISPRMLLNASLRTLSLSNCTLSDRTVEELARVLASHKAIQHLSLQQNGLGDPAAHALAGLVRCNTTLRSINLADNAVSDEGGLALCTALATPQSSVSFLSLRVNQCGPASATAVLSALALKRTSSCLHVDFAGNVLPWVLYARVQSLSARNQSQFERGALERNREEVASLRARHEHRLQLEDQCLVAIEELEHLQLQLQELEASVPEFKDAESRETKRVQAELDACTHSLHEAHAAERAAESAAAAHSKEIEGSLMSLRRNLEKESRFNVTAAKSLLPQALEELAAAQGEAEEDLVDLKRDLRMALSERNEQREAAECIVGDFGRMVRDMERKVAGTGGARKGGGAAKGAAAGGGKSRPASRKRTPSNSPRKSSRPATAVAGSARKGKSGTASTVTAAPRAGSRPPSAASRPKSVGAVTAASAPLGPIAPKTPAAAAGGKKKATPSAGARPPSSKKGSAPKSRGADAQPAADTTGRATPGAGDSALVALAQAQAAQS